MIKKVDLQAGKPAKVRHDEIVYTEPDARAQYRFIFCNAMSPPSTER